MKYLSSDPFSSRPTSEAYRAGWEKVFGKKAKKPKANPRLGEDFVPEPTDAEILAGADYKCRVCRGSGRRETRHNGDYYYYCECTGHGGELQ